MGGGAGHPGRLHRGPGPVPPQQLQRRRLPQLQPRHPRRHRADPLKQYLRQGGGFVGIHNAFGAEYSFPYYEGLLGGANFYNHGPNRDGTVETVNNTDVSTEGLPEEWAFKDEWYNLVPFPSFVNVLAEVDAETSLEPTGVAATPRTARCTRSAGATTTTVAARG